MPTTSLLTIRREDKNEPLGLEEALALAKSSNSPFLVNTSSDRAALGAPASSLTLDDGSVEERVRLIRPLSRDAVPKARLAASHWQVAAEEEFHVALARRSLAKFRPRVRAKSISSPDCCCPSGNICPALQARSTGCKPMTASASSAA